MRINVQNDVFRSHVEGIRVQGVHEVSGVTNSDTKVKHPEGTGISLRIIRAVTVLGKEVDSPAEV